ncbi:MAG: hypothetical protein ACK55Z_11075 [bacterium]
MPFSSSPPPPSRVTARTHNTAPAGGQTTLACGHLLSMSLGGQLLSRKQYTGGH